MTMCPICHVNNKLIVDLKPPTAGARLLVLDGGGIRGIFTILAIRALDAVRKLPYPIYDDFDLAIGTSSGTSTATHRSLHY
jgi:patatin-like phospholipase/acyl hydrolase